MAPPLVGRSMEASRRSVARGAQARELAILLEIRAMPTFKVFKEKKEVGQDWTARLPGGEEERKEKKEKMEKEKKEKEKKEKEKKEVGQDWTARLPEAGWRVACPCWDRNLWCYW